MAFTAILNQEMPYARDLETILLFTARSRKYQKRFVFPKRSFPLQSISCRFCSAQPKSQLWIFLSPDRIGKPIFMFHLLLVNIFSQRIHDSRHATAPQESSVWCGSLGGGEGCPFSFLRRFEVDRSKFGTTADSHERPCTGVHLGCTGDRKEARAVVQNLPLSLFSFLRRELRSVIGLTFWFSLNVLCIPFMLPISTWTHQRDDKIATQCHTAQMAGFRIWVLSMRATTQRAGARPQSGVSASSPFSRLWKANV